MFREWADPTRRSKRHGEARFAERFGTEPTKIHLDRAACVRLALSLQVGLQVHLCQFVRRRLDRDRRAL